MIPPCSVPPSDLSDAVTAKYVKVGVFIAHIL